MGVGGGQAVSALMEQTGSPEIQCVYHIHHNEEMDKLILVARRSL